MNKREFLKSTAATVVTGLSVNEAFARQFIFDPSLNFRGDGRGSQNNFQTIEQQQEYKQILPQANQVDFWDKPRRIFIQRQQTGERAELFYWANGGINYDHFRLASYLLRDVRQQRMINIDIELLDLMAAVQAWLTYFGYRSPMLVTSGFRTSRTNSSLEGAAKNSMHLHGRAVDFTVPGLNVRDVARIASHFQAGGVGIHPSRNFIHLDTGRVRTWVR